MHNLNKTNFYKKQKAAQLLKILVVECRLYAHTNDTYLRTVEPTEGELLFEKQMKNLACNIDILTERLHELGYNTQQILSELIDNAGNVHDFHKSTFDGIVYDMLFLHQQTVKLIQASTYWSSGFTEKDIIITFVQLLKNHEELIDSITLYMRKYHFKNKQYRWTANAKKINETG